MMVGRLTTFSDGIFSGVMLNLWGVKHQRKKWKHFSILIPGNSSLIFLVFVFYKNKNELSQQLEVTSNLVSYRKFTFGCINLYLYIHFHIPHIYIYTVYRWFDLFLHRVAFWIIKKNCCHGISRKASS